MTTRIWEEASKELDKLFEAKAKALGAMKNAPRTCKSHFGMYADLATIWDTIRKPLSENGLDVIQSFAPFGEDGGIMLVTTLGHSSGQFIRSFLPIKAGLQPQQLAATATYLRRVELAAIVGVAAEDDDDGAVANSAATQAIVNNEANVESKAVKALRDAKDSAGRAKVIAHAERLVGGGELQPAALGRLKLIESQLEADARKPEQKKAEPALATA